MSHIEKRANLWYATLTIPADVRHIIGKMKFIQSTKTADKAGATLRAGVLIVRWKAQITKARGQLPNQKDSFWESLRRDYLAAEGEGNEGLMLVIEDLVEKEAAKATSQREATLMYKTTTNQVGVFLTPLVEAWKASLRLSPQTLNQQYRDVLRMSGHFVSLDAVQVQAVKAWTDTLLDEELPATGLKRISVGCRSFWMYLRRSGSLSMDAPDPFTGPFRLAQDAAKRVATYRRAFTADELTKVYEQVLTDGHHSLAQVIALGAMTGARIEEICTLKVTNCIDGVFNVVDSKTDAGIRQIPIHPALISLVNKMIKESTDGYLVPSTAAGQYGVRSAAHSQRFGRVKKAMGFGKSHVFHSIRKTVATQLEQAGVVESIAADILGHEKKTMSYGLYSSGSSMAQKREALSRVVYGGALGSP